MYRTASCIHVPGSVCLCARGARPRESAPQKYLSALPCHLHTALSSPIDDAHIPLSVLMKCNVWRYLNSYDSAAIYQRGHTPNYFRAQSGTSSGPKTRPFVGRSERGAASAARNADASDTSAETAPRAPQSGLYSWFRALSALAGCGRSSNEQQTADIFRLPTCRRDQQPKRGFLPALQSFQGTRDRDRTAWPRVVQDAVKESTATRLLIL